MSLRLGVLWSGLQGVGGRALQFATGVVMARLLVPEDFGLIATVQVFTGFAGLVAGGGIMQALVRQKDCSDTDLNSGFTVQLLVAALLYLLFWFTVAPLAATWLEDPRYLLLIQVSALGFFIRPFWNSASTRLQRDMRFKVLAVNSLWSVLVGSLVSIAMALSNYGFWALVISGLAGSMTNSLLNSIAARSWPSLALNRESIRRFYRAGYGFAFINIVTHISEKGVALVISKMLGAAPLGLYNKGQSLAVMPNELAGSALQKPLFRAMAGERDNPEHLRYLFTRAVGFMALLIWPALGLLAWYGEQFIVLVYGEHWREAGYVLQIFALTALFQAFNRPAVILLSSGRGLGSYIRILGTMALLLMGATIYLAGHGLYAVAAGIACIQVMQTMILLIKAMQLHHIPALPILKGVCAPLTGLVGMLAVLVLLGMETSPLYLAGWTGLFGQLIVGLGIYAFMLWLTPHSLARQEIRRLVTMLNTLLLRRYNKP